MNQDDLEDIAAKGSLLGLTRECNRQRRYKENWRDLSILLIGLCALLCWAVLEK